ncbi:FAD-binding oxidoreductase [Azospirillum doebereinerae]|uniref:FAD-binding oxidoreductase n=1 Tax=Azospirillum doebereinerae TaxID=92933 RepID=A0A433JA37_9PROT|nr:FAD-binding oxidoreductase [Azospirillum doebereinerae]RUQ72182.1 FAD-binding oxidoreductase [Azospirillum doebereinerae]
MLTVRDRLIERLGPSGVLSDPADLTPYVTGPRRFTGACGLVARPATVEETAAVVALAAEHGCPVVPQGGNTGLCDGAIPTDPRAILLNLGRMNRIRAVDPLSYTMTAEAGVILAHAQAAAADADLLFPLSLGAEGSCQIGGNLATNAGGKSVLRYGSARDLVLGLEVVLPDGRIWNGLRSLRKDNTGGDLKQLFLGSEGTLGIITAALLKLQPSVADTACAFAAVADPLAALKLLDRLRRRTGDAISSFELMNAYALEVAVRHLPGAVHPLSEPAAWTVLVELSSSRAGGDLNALLTEALAEALEDGLVTDATLAQNTAQTAAFWRLRDEGATLYWKEGGLLLHDPSVPLARVPDFIERVEREVGRAVPGARIASFGHIGDGNIHVCVSQPKGMDKRAFLALRGLVQDLVYGAAVDLGGSFSAEHGIGRLKMDELVRYRPPVEIALMTTLKRALDPAGLMNPGKVLAAP